MCEEENGKIEKTSSNLFRTERNERFGRYLVASEDISAGQIIFREDPIMMGPKRFSKPICLGCHRSVDGSCFCSKCGFPMCSSTCQNLPIHANNECGIFAKKSSKPKRLADYNSHQPLYQCIFPLRLLLLRNTDSKLWKKLNEMEDHVKQRELNCPEDWQMNQVNIVQFLRGWCGLVEFDEETIHRVIGIIEVNGFEIKTVDNIEIAGIYERGSIACQDCQPNTHHAFTQDCQLIFRTSVPIPAGQMITMSYVPALIGTMQRCQNLRATKYFQCICDRCKDPTETGTFISAIKCLHCPNGYLLPEDPLVENSPWICNKESISNKKGGCENSVPVDKILSSLGEIRNAIDSVTTSNTLRTTEELEKLIQTYSTNFLHPNHFLLIPILNKLYQMYTIASIRNGEKQWDKRINEITVQLLNISDKLQPGLTRSRGVLLYELCLNRYQKAKQEFIEKKITQEEFDIERKRASECMKTTEQIFELDKTIGVPFLRNFTID